MKEMQTIDTIIVHCSATMQGRDYTAADIDRWHKQRGWDGIGYHYVVRRDGTVEAGRPLPMQGAHCATRDKDGVSWNTHSIGICYIGGLDGNRHPKDTRTVGQDRALRVLIAKLCRDYPITRVTGHRDASPDANGDGRVTSGEWLKDCPCFDAGREYGQLIEGGKA